VIASSARWRNLGTAAGGVTAVLFAIFDLYQWGLAYAGDRFHNDFTFYFAAAKIGVAHGWGSIYDLALQQAQLDAMGSRITIAQLARYISPPPVAWSALPFTALPYEAAYWTWSALLVAALGAVWWLAAPEAGRARIFFLAAAVGWLPVIYGLQLGQPGLFVALGVAGSYALLKADRPFLAGLALGALALKPQLAFLVPPALLVTRHYRAFFGSVVALGVLGVASAVAVGLEGLQAYLDRLSFAAGVPVNSELTIAYFVGAGTATRVIQLAFAVWSLGLATLTRRRGIEWVYACALVGGMLATPYVHLDDLVMLGLAAWLVLRGRPARWTWLYALAGALAIEGEPFWGPTPVILAELGALALLSLAALTAEPRTEATSGSSPESAPAVPHDSRLTRPTTLR